MKTWDTLKTPPASALKKIGGGRLSGMTDINPQWRWQKLTEVFGPCGSGWYYKITRLWTEPGSDGQVMAFAMVELIISGYEFPIPGVGGSMLIVNEKNGPHNNDEAFKMAITDAIGTAAKMIGLGADIYMGKWDGSKYKEEPKPPAYITKEDIANLQSLIKETETNEAGLLDYAKADLIAKITVDKLPILIALLQKKKDKMRQPGEEG